MTLRSLFENEYSLVSHNISGSIAEIKATHKTILGWSRNSSWGIERPMNRIMGTCLRTNSQGYGNVPSKRQSVLGKCAFKMIVRVSGMSSYNKSQGYVNVPSTLESELMECAHMNRIMVKGMCP